MKHPCKNLCSQHYPDKKSIYVYFKQGMKKCHVCGFSAITKDIKCRCCTRKMSYKRQYMLIDKEKREEMIAYSRY